ncbi:hypothetical protein HBI93_005630 [Parastagonospora nodorum]|nr:hypothetical protein HBH50_052440 [Parastagonospora nodorum]KAH5795828.1 hypothetical protein HBI97_018100 [Parastagonospora nodorum]KAH5842881.1 hypothetical protein HBI93_005630 [Parastagonospora nodorum]KAH5877917.1 hypothetical protein HBI91_044410 [Parastagonospora nodorum]KAH5915428.1 hypothetical protein HBI89_034080 [Parastagonospora nodorum]
MTIEHKLNSRRDKRIVRLQRNMAISNKCHNSTSKVPKSKASCNENSSFSSLSSAASSLRQAAVSFSSPSIAAISLRHAASSGS